MTKSPDAFRTISEVAEWLGVQAHVLRFWESKFSQVKPVKRAGGRRYYRPSDMQLLGGIKKLLHDDGLTIKGVQKTLREQGVTHVTSLSQSLDEGAPEPVKTTDSTILPFQSAAAAKADLPVADPVDVAPQDEAPEQVPEPAAPEAETVAESIAPEPEELQAANPEPTADIAPPAAPEPDPTRLPSFIHTPASSETPEAPETAAEEPEPETVVTPRPNVVDAPDPPALEDLPYTPGALAKLAKINRLSAEQASQIAPVAAELKVWLAGFGTTGPT